MSDVGDDYKAMDAAKRARREQFGVPCPGCKIKVPKAHATILLPGQRCRVCRYVDPRPLPCQWTWGMDGFWATLCGKAFRVHPGTPTDNEFRHCPFCGGALIEVPPSLEGT